MGVFFVNDIFIYSSDNGGQNGHWVDVWRELCSPSTVGTGHPMVAVGPSFGVRMTPGGNSDDEAGSLHRADPDWPGRSNNRILSNQERG